MNRRFFWTVAAGVVALAAAVPLLAQDRGQSKAQQNAALAEHNAQEQREREEAAERAKRREAARSGNDPRQKEAPRKEEEEEGKRDPR